MTGSSGVVAGQGEVGAGVARPGWRARAPALGWFGVVGHLDVGLVGLAEDARDAVGFSGGEPGGDQVDPDPRQRESPVAGELDHLRVNVGQ